MADILMCLLSVATFILIYTLIKLKEYSNACTLNHLVAWCVTTDSSEYRCNLKLTDYIYNAQIQERIPKEYWIKGAEWDLAKEIIEHFQKILVQNYFNGTLSVPKSKYVISGEDFFMFKLSSFLEKHQCDDTFIGHDMYRDKISYTAYGSWGGQLYDATYSITEFAAVYHKLYYISYLVCRNSEIFNQNGDAFQNGDSIKEILDTNQIKISRY